MANLRFSPMKAFYPTADELLAANQEQLAETVLRHLKTYEGGGTVHQPVGGFSRAYYIQTMDGTIRGLGALPTTPEYGDKQPQVSSRIQEAWHRLEREGLLMHNPNQPYLDWYTITTDGEALLARLARYEHWEKLGVDQVKADLEHTGGVRVGCAAPEVTQMAWEWVRAKTAAGNRSIPAPQLLDEINELLNEVPQRPTDNTVPAWWGRARNLIEQWEPTKSSESNRAAELYFSHLESLGPGASERRRAQQQMVTLLNQAKHDFGLRTSPMNTAPTPAAPFNTSRKVFVVHGHDEGAREKIARFLERLDFEPIILHEQASLGRTVIEKVEAHRDVGFAVVLLTPDDEGCEKGGTPRPRARQNVVLELGYFLGYLGRNRVCPLKRGDLEIPSDFEGVVYVPFDTSEGWKQALGKELEGVGFKIDWNKAMGARA